MSFVATPLAAGYTVSDGLLIAAALFVTLAIAMLYRAILGPILALLGAALGEPWFLDIALVYALLNFLMSIAISKFTVERGGVI